MPRTWPKLLASEALAPLQCAAFDAEFQLEIAAEGDAQKLPKFSMTAYTGVPMRLSNYGPPVVIDLSSVRVPHQNVPVPINHDVERIAGHTTKIEVSAQRIKASGVLSGGNEHAADVSTKAANGFPWQASVGGESPASIERVEAGEECKVNGRVMQGPLLIAKGVTIREISLCPIGADGNTSADVMAHFHKDGSIMNFDVWLKAKGKDKATLSAEELTTLQAQFEAEKKPAPPAPAPPSPPANPLAPVPSQAEWLQQMRATYAQETERQHAIAGIAGRYGVSELEIEDPVKPGSKIKVSLVAHAVREGWTSDQVELAALRAARPSVPGGLVYSRQTPQVSEAVLEAAILDATRCRLFEDAFYNEASPERDPIPTRHFGRLRAQWKHRYTDQVQQTAHDLYKGRIGLQQVLTTIAAAGGYQGGEVIRDDGVLGQVAQACMRQMDLPVRADGSSTLSLGNVTANVLNKFILQGYLMVEQSWREIAAIRSVKDFKPAKSINLFGDTEFKAVGTSGEISHGTLQDQAFANQVATVGRMLTIPRTIIINDDLGFLGQMPMILGRGAGLKLNKDFWTKWLSPGFDDGGSTNFFAANHTLTGGMTGNSNLLSGGTSALSSAALTAAVLLFDNQIDPMGNPLGVDPEVLLYPSDLDTTARELMNAQYFVYGGASASKQPNTNIWQGRFNPVKARYLNKSAYTGYSTMAWWLIANPEIIPCIEVAFLNGQEMPIVQQAGPDFNFNILGISTRAYFDIGINMQNFRGGVKSNGV